MRAVLFDVDGVLVDSLPQHLAYCRDLAHRRCMPDVVVPEAMAFRHMVDVGVKVSPMRAMFEAFQFPQSSLDEAVHDYDHSFLATFSPEVFPGVHDVLRELRALGLRLGLVTANVRANVVPVLGRLMDTFEPDLCHYFDSTPEPRGKAERLSQAVALLECSRTEVLYVGDQPADAAAAAEAGVRFLAVSYGWGFAGEPNLPHAVSSIGEIVSRVQSNQFSR